MARSHEYTQGRRAGLKWAISWLHERANEMNDPHAKAVLNSAAFNLGVENRTDNLNPRQTAIFDGTVTIEQEVYINGIRYDPGVYQAHFQKAPTEETNEPRF